LQFYRFSRKEKELAERFVHKTGEEKEAVFFGRMDAKWQYWRETGRLWSISEKKRACASSRKPLQANSLWS